MSTNSAAYLFAGACHHGQGRSTDADRELVRHPTMSEAEVRHAAAAQYASGARTVGMENTRGQIANTHGHHCPVCVAAANTFARTVTRPIVTGGQLVGALSEHDSRRAAIVEWPATDGRQYVGIKSGNGKDRATLVAKRDHDKPVIRERVILVGDDALVMRYRKRDKSLTGSMRKRAQYVIRCHNRGELPAPR